MNSRHHLVANQIDWLTIFKVMLALLLLCSALLAQAADKRGIGLEKNTGASVNPYSPGQYRALIIGNNDYKDDHGEWTPLKTAVSGAHEVKSLLKNNYGFSDIKLLENATRKDVLVALQELSKRAMPEDNVLVYYAGHGFMDMETDKGFWVPVDARGFDNTTFLRNSTIRDELTSIASRAKHTLLVSDSCFSGTLLRRGTRGVNQTPNSELYYKKVANKKSVQIMAAGGVEYVDDNYRSSGHSPFTYFLLNELKNNDRPMLTVSELSNNVERAVANNVDQVPESGVLQGAGDELGEFIFIKLNVAVDGVPADKVKVQVNVVPANNVVKGKAAGTQAPTTVKQSLPIPTL